MKKELIAISLENNNELPQYQTSGSAGCDLQAKEDFIIQPHSAQLVFTGIKIALPDQFVGFVTSRSGLALKNRVFVLNAPGIIDRDYRGEIGVILFNASNDIFYGKKNMRIAQLLILKYIQAEFQIVDNLDETDRNGGGFGSTGL